MGRGLRSPIAIPGRERRRRLSFALTPLADAMFQLLIFFMLSSSLAPYSLITLRGGAAQASEPVEPAAAEVADSVIWQLVRGGVRISGEVTPLDQLQEPAQALAEEGTNLVVLFVGRAATVQDIATVTETLTAAGINGVQLVGRTGG